MPLYLTRFSYAPETWARLVARSEVRRKAAGATCISITTQGAVLP